MVGTLVITAGNTALRSDLGLIHSWKFTGVEGYNKGKSMLDSVRSISEW